MIINSKDYYFHWQVPSKSHLLSFYDSPERCHTDSLGSWSLLYSHITDTAQMTALHFPMLYPQYKPVTERTKLVEWEGLVHPLHSFSPSSLYWCYQSSWHLILFVSGNSVMWMSTQYKLNWDHQIQFMCITTEQPMKGIASGHYQMG